MSLRLRLILLAGVCILPSIILLAGSQWQLRQAREAEVQRELSELATAEAGEVGAILNGARQMLSVLGRTQAVLQHNAPLCSAWLARLVQDNPSYASIRADDLTGRAYCSSDPGRAAFDGNADYFREAVESRGVALGTATPSPLSGETELPLARVITENDGTSAGVLVVGIDLGRLTRDLRLKLPPDSLLTVRDANGAAVLQVSGTRSPAHIADKDWIVASVPVGNGTLGMQVTAARPRQAALLVSKRMTRDGLLLIGVALLLACLAAAWVGRRFIRTPIRALLAATERLRQGEFAARSTLHGASELAQLGAGLNALARELEEREQAQLAAEARLRQFAATLEQRVDERTRALAEANRQLAAEAEQRQRTQAELAQVQKLDAIGKLTGGIAHDFNNLLAAVLGSLELALPRTEEPRMKRLLSVAEQAAQRGAKLTQHLLAFSRKQDLVLQPVAMNAVIAGMGDLLGRTLGTLVRLEYDLADDLWPATADPVQLEVALLNLAINARDAMPEGGRLAFRTRNMHMAPGPHAGITLPSGDYAMAAVIDTGEGMPPDVAAKAFEPFFTTKGPGKGTGLGLSMVYGFARQAGGTVTVDSTPGKGTAVSLYLPRAAAPAASESQPPAAAETASPGLRLRLLLVDDDALVREMTAEMLREHGHTVAEAADPDAALQALRTHHAPELLVVDFAMPEMTGDRLAEQARSLWPGLPVLIVTGYAEAETVRAWSEHGWQVLRKPFTPAELIEAIRAAMAAAARNEA